MPSLVAVKRAPGGRSSTFEDDPVLPAAVLGWTSSAPATGFCGVVAGASVFLSLAGFSALVSSFGASATAPSSITAITCWLVTVAPSSNLISLSTPSTVDGTSSTTLSVSRSTRFSSRLTASSAFLRHDAMTASETDSGRTGTLISVAMMGGVLMETWKGGVWLFCDGFAVERVDQRVGDQLLLLGDVVVEVSHRRRRRTRAAGVVQYLLRRQAGDQVVADLVPRALVVRLFLAPDHVGGLRVALELRGQQFARERIQLLDADQRHVVGIALVHVLEQVVVHLARAQHDAPGLLRIAGGVGDQLLEAALGKLVQRRHG